MRNLGPSPDLLRGFQGKGRRALTVEEYHTRYRREMADQHESIRELAERLDYGESVTLLCSKDCLLPAVCHRTVLAEMIEHARPSHREARS
jgi:uncharacterized protein YeaO (DUF488 family)